MRWQGAQGYRTWWRIPFSSRSCFRRSNSSELRGFPRVRRPVVPAQAGTSPTAIRDSCLPRNDGHLDTEQLLAGTSVRNILGSCLRRNDG